MEEGRLCKGQRSLLLKHLVLERVALDTHSLVQCFDEERVELRQELAVAEWEYEALGEASSCHSAVHGLPHRGEHWENHVQNKLGTDLQWDWADTAAAVAAGGAAGHMLPHGSQEEAAGHTRRTLAVVVRHRARQYGQARRPASEQRRA